LEKLREMMKSDEPTRFIIPEDVDSLIPHIHKSSSEKYNGFYFLKLWRLFLIIFIKTALDQNLPKCKKNLD
jgi:hypothetical protein